MKQLRFRAAEYADQRKMTIYEKMALQDFVDKKLHSFLPLNSGTLDLMVRNLEDLMDQGFEFVKDKTPKAADT